MNTLSYHCDIRRKEHPLQVDVLGCGRWGSILAWYLDRIGHQVTLYGRPGSRTLAQLTATRQNDYLTLPASIQLTDQLEAAQCAEVVVISIPTQQLQSLAEQLAALPLQGKPVVLCMKGVEIGTGRRLSQIITDTLDPSNTPAVWIGPGHPQDFLRGIPNCMSIDSADNRVKHQLVDAFSSELIRFYYGTDLIGNEIGAAAKNVIGIAAGLLDGFGIRALKGALMSRGTREIGRLIAAMGGQERSAYGLCHLGDYEATLFSPHSHNRQFGEAWATGAPYDKLAEGYYTVQALMTLAQRYQVELPICQAVYDILYRHADAAQTLDGLFRRSLKDEN